MSGQTIRLIERVFDARYPSFDSDVFKALSSSGVAEFPIHIDDDQLDAALEALRQSFEHWPLSEKDAWSLFVDADEREDMVRTFDSQLEPLIEEKRSREIVRQFLLAAANFNDKLWKLYDEGAYDELHALDNPIQKRALAARLADGVIQDYHRFFNSVDSGADFSIWAKRWPWTLEQATALSFGKNPDIVNSNSLAEVETPKTTSPFVEAFATRLEIFRSAAARGEIGNEVYPSDWKTLAELGDFPPPIDLLLNQESVKVRRKRGTLESTYHRILLGLALYHYGFKLNQESSDPSKIYSKIVSDILSVGLKVDEDTIKVALLKARDWARATDQKPKERLVAKASDSLE